MKIQGENGTQIGKNNPKPSAAKNRKISSPGSKRPGEKDSVELSSRSDEVRRLTELAKLTPDMRADKVKAIKKRIKAGTYNIPADSVARSIADFHKKLKA